MHTWDGLVELLDGDAVLGTAHVDLAAEKVGDHVEWWGLLRGATPYGVRVGQRLTLRLPDGNSADVILTDEDPHDPYHRIDFRGEGMPPF